MTEYRLGWGGKLIGWIVAAFFVLPLLVVGITAFGKSSLITNFPPHGYTVSWFHDLLTDPDWTSAMSTSLKVAGISMALALLLGVPLGVGLARSRLGRIKLVQALVGAPMIIPVVTLAIGFFFLSAKLHLLGSMVPLIMAHTTLGLPLVVVTVVATLRGLDPSLEPAARTLGAPPLRALRTVTLPLLAPGILAGAVFAFLASWDDIVNAVFLGTATIRTFPLQLWTQMNYNLTPLVPAAAVLLSSVGVAVVALAALVLYARRRRTTRAVAENILLRRGLGS